MAFQIAGRTERSNAPSANGCGQGRRGDKRYMKQVVQSFRTGELLVMDVPSPAAGRGKVLVRNAASLVSAGTERMIVDFAKKNLLEKARSRPDLVREVLNKAWRDGALTTLDAVHNRLDQPLALGYSSAGVVVEVGAGVSEFKNGDPVACAGGGYAVHAELVSVPKNLVVKLPENVDFESAAFTTLGAVAMQGIRLAEAKLGEIVAVIGLGLLGQPVVQMLKAAGCIVVGMDKQPSRAALAQQLGADAVTTTAEGLLSLCQQFSGGHGADAVVITADTRSNEPLQVAGQVARNKGIVSAIGAVGMTIPRSTYYEKELDFRISRSYGPGRYDTQYEEEGHDYPYGYVRWTEKRNMQAFAQLLSKSQVRLQPLITHRFPIEDASAAYALITGKPDEPFLGVLLTYPESPNTDRKMVSVSKETIADAGVNKPGSSDPLNKITIGIIGAGGFANSILLPAVKGVTGIGLVGVASGGGLSARSTAERFGFAYSTTDMQQILNDPDINTVAIATRHHLHARQVVAALNARKRVFVEKPLCLNLEELQEIIATYRTLANGPALKASRFPFLMVGFNRRFAPFVVELKRQLQSVQEPLMLHYRVNAGHIPLTHWVQDPLQGGGRLLGEVCHIVDLLIHLSSSCPMRVTTRSLPNSERYRDDNLLITLEFSNGSLGEITYVANGDTTCGKEYLEVFGGGLAARLDDYRVLTIHRGKQRIRRTSRLRQDKGHRAEWQALGGYLTGGGDEPMPFSEIVRTTETMFAAQRSLQTGEPVALPGEARSWAEADGHDEVVKETEETHSTYLADRTE